MQEPVHFEIIKKKLKKKTKREMEKPLWFEINEKEFQELSRYIYSNQDNNDFKIIINKKNLWFEIRKKNWNESKDT